MDTLFATVERVDVGFSTGAERPNLNARNLDGMVAGIWLYDNPVSAVEAEAIAASMSSQYLTGGGVVQLQPGDADQNFDFNQLDIVKVQVAAKYLTGQPATWGEGDWDGGPGGSQGNPPIGNGQFDQMDIVAALTAGKYLTGPYGALGPGGELPALGDVDLMSVPEPSAAVLLLLGAIGRLTVGRRRRSR
jgi:hypothetical protein